MIRSAARDDGMEWYGLVGIGLPWDGIAGAMLRIAGDDSLGVRIKI